MTINLTYDPHINEMKPNLENREYIQVIGDFGNFADASEKLLAKTEAVLQENKKLKEAPKVKKEDE